MAVIALLAVAPREARTGADAGRRVPPGPVTIRVKLAPEGKPAAGIMVHLGGRSAPTAADGMAVLDGVPAGSYKLIVAQIGYARLEKSVTLPAGVRQPIDITLGQVKPVSLAGTVVLEGGNRGIAGARMSLAPVQVAAAINGRIDFSSDWEGKFSVLEMPPGKYRLEVAAPGCAEKSFDVTLDKDAKDAAFAVKAATTPASMKITVTDADGGKPIANAKVTLAEAWPAGTIATGTTDGGGQALLKSLKTGLLNWMDDKGQVAVGRRQVTVHVEAEGYEPNTVAAALDANALASVTMNPARAIEDREPNDDMASTQSIRSGAPVACKLAKIGDRDFYRFRLPYPGRVHLELGSKDIIETYLQLLSAEGRVIAERCTYSGENNGFEAAVGAGEYFVRVAEWGDNSASDKPMNMRVNYTPAADPFEPNNASTAARLIHGGEQVRGMIYPVGDVDCYRFEAKRAGWVRFTMPAVPVEMAMSLRNARGEVVQQAFVYAKNPLELVATIAAGWHTLEVREWGDNGCALEPYTVRFEHVDDDGIDDPPFKAGALSAVRTLELSAFSGSTICPVGDIDRYSLALPGSGVIHARVRCPIETALRLYAANGQLLAEAYAYANNPAELAWHCPSPRTVYLEVREWGDNNASQSPYVLSNFWEPCDEHETAGRNETAEAATPLEWTDVIRGTIVPVGDVDCFRVTAEHPGYIVLDGHTPIEMALRLKDGKGKTLAETFAYANNKIGLSAAVLPGEYIVEAREWGDNGSLMMPYQINARLHRADPQEKAPLRDDTIRGLRLGTARSVMIEHVGDRDRFALDMPKAGKLAIRAWMPLEYCMRVFDAKSGKQVAETYAYATNHARIDLETKGPESYRIEVTEWGDNGCSTDSGYILADVEGRELVAEEIEAKADAMDPTLVHFARRSIKGVAGATLVRVDADGDGKSDIDIPAGGAADFRYRNEGTFVATVVCEAANGVKTTRRIWVDAAGPRERKGVHLVVSSPGEGQLVETEEPARLSAISYSGAKIARVALSADGRPMGVAYTAPWQIEIPWKTLGKGEHTLTFVATDAAGEKATVQRKVRVSEYFDLQPADGAVLTGNNIAVSWTGSFGPAVVRYRPVGQTQWTDVVGQNAAQRRVAMADLEAGKTYEFQPVGTGEPGPVRTVTRVKGLAFGQSRYGAAIKRDYDQRLGVSVRNHGEKPMTVKLECGKPQDPTLLVGFVGEGSEGAPVNLAPGEEREFMLGLSAQDVKKADHKFPIRITSDSGYADEAEVDVAVKLPMVKLEWELLGPATSGVGQRYRLHNKGDTLTDLEVASSSPEMILSPSINHGILVGGQSVDVTAHARLFEGFKSAEAKLSARAVDKEQPADAKAALPDGKTLYGVQLISGYDPQAKQTSLESDILTARSMVGGYLNPSYVDWSKKTNPQDTDGDGRLDRWSVEDKAEDILWVGDDSDGDGQIDFVHADIGGDGQYDYSAFKAADGWEPTNLVEAWLEMGFKLPWARTAYEKHDADIVMNGVVVGKLRDTIPEGNYTFRLPPSAIKFNEAGSPDGNEIEIQSKHLRGGHYVVSSDFRIKARMTGTRVWTVADSQDDADKKARSAEGLTMEGADYSVSSAELQLDGPPQIAKGNDVAVVAPIRNVGATRSKDVAVALVRSVPGGQGVELTREYVTDVPLSGARTIRLPWKAAAGTHTLKVVIDPDKEVTDTNRDNNEAMITLTVAGEDAKPTVKILSPAEGETLKQTIADVAAEVADDSGVAKTELRIDRGLWMALQPLSHVTFGSKTLLQPGSHALTVRVTDSCGNQVEQTVNVKVDARSPEAQIVEPAEGAKIDKRSTNVIVKVGEGVAAVGVRVNGGAWKQLPVKDGKAQGALDVPFGNGRVEAAVVDSTGARTTVGCGVTCTAQPTAEEAASPQESPNRPENGGDTAVGGNNAAAGANNTAAGNANGIRVGNAGQVDPFGPPNTVVRPDGAAGGNQPRGGQPGGNAGPPAATDDPAAPANGGNPATGGHPAATDAGDGGVIGDNADADSAPASAEGEVGSAPATDAQPDTIPPIAEDNPNLKNRPTVPPTDETPAAGGNAAPAPAYAAPTGPVRPAGGFVAAQARQSDWYCTNRPNIKVKFQLPDYLKRRNLTWANKAEFDKMVKKFLDRMKAQGIKTDQLEKFQEALRRRIRQMDQPGELPGFLESLGFAKPKTNDPEELRKWHEQMERAADAWYLKLLSSGDPRLVAEGLKARGEAIGKFDEAMQLHANAAIEQIHANQKLVEDVADSLPIVGDMSDVYAAVTGECALSGDRLSALERAIRLASVLGPAGLEQLVKRSPTAQLVLEGIGEMGQAMGQSGKEMLARVLGKEVKNVDEGLEAISKFLTKERSLTRNAMEDQAERAGKTFANSAEGLADAKIMTKDIDEAQNLIDRLKKSSPDSDEFKQAVRELQTNKTAQGLINAKNVPDDLRKQVNGEIKDIYRNADKGTKDSLESLYKGDLSPQDFQKRARELGVDPAEAARFRDKVNEAARKAGVDPKDIDVDVMTVTNKRTPKPGEVEVTSVGRDRDVTYVIKTKDGKVLGDIDHAVSKGPYEQSFYKNSKGGDLPRTPDGNIDHKAISSHADDMDQCVTSKKHLEAYNTGEVQLNDFLDKSKAPTLTRIEDVRDTVAFKSEHWFGKAAKETNPAMASRDIAEGMRQATKQYDDLVMSRVKQYGLTPGNVPPQLRSSMDIFKQVKDGKISPKQAEAMLAAIGTTKEKAVKNMAGFLEGMEKTAGVGYRRVKTADLVNSLHSLPGKGSKEWTGQALNQINNALANGHISGQVFTKLRADALNGMLKMPRTPAWKQDMRGWITTALANRLISQAEKAMLEKEVQ